MQHGKTVRRDVGWNNKVALFKMSDMYTKKKQVIETVVRQDSQH